MIDVPPWAHSLVVRDYAHGHEHRGHIGAIGERQVVGLSGQRTRLPYEEAALYLDWYSNVVGNNEYDDDTRARDLNQAKPEREVASWQTACSSVLLPPCLVLQAGSFRKTFNMIVSHFPGEHRVCHYDLLRRPK